MLALYVLAFLDRSNIGFAKETYQLDTGLSNEAYALGPVSSLWSMPSSGCRPIC
ncbi:transporter, major facilitator family protein [Klebsiella pneumoniae]|nr:transporter, major facilitator family protein [Klebsiella pneumoniae]